ncbi:MAG: metalloregulator ArsR/SmtB family transcription factor [Thermoplasmata archaeon]|jgi:DNA-binding transcriptional ArsR family regulator|nr:metalloregulator ArsR/SmtB family transcription factor [Thermoplasmata archaeon]
MSNLSEAFEVLADPTRLRIVEELRGGERSVGSIVSTLGVCQPGVSRHLRILHQAGFVQSHPDGQRRLYSLQRKPFRALDAWIHDYRDLVEARLDRLGQLVGETGPSYRPATKNPRRE